MKQLTSLLCFQAHLIKNENRLHLKEGFYESFLQHQSLKKVIL